MVMAGTMLAHQVASKAVREAVFLSGPGIERLPLMVMVTALASVAAVPGYSRLLAAFGPRAVVPWGFAVSAVAHLIEWRLPVNAAWVAALIYIHVAGLGAILLSGFWSLLSEIFDPRSAKESYGPIAASGTIGGLAGGAVLLAAPIDASLLVLAALHAACAGGIWWLARRAPHSTLAEPAGPSPRLFDWETLRRAPYVGTLALLVVLSTASAGILDFLFKKGVAGWADSRAALQQFFVLFYMATGVLTFVAQSQAGALVQSAGLGRTVASLPAGLGAASTLAMVVPSFWLVAIARGVEAVLRGSWFRSGYELLFVPVAPAEKRRTKTFLDVTCDRAGEALGAAVVQAIVFAAAASAFIATYHANGLLAIVVGLSALTLWVSRKIDHQYTNVIAGRLADQVDADSIPVQSETGWTLLELPTELKAARTQLTRTPVAPAPVQEMDPKLRVLADLRSGDRHRVESALRALSRPDRTEVAQLIQLLAWDDMVPFVRLTLERVADRHVGLLEDALRDRESDFAIRRRVPRVLGTLDSYRALNALLGGLDDPRFEVRYQCARAINRVVGRSALKVDPDRVMAVVERELSVPLQMWEGHRILDESDPSEELEWHDPQQGTTERNLEHIFSLLALVLPRDALTAAFRGMTSNDPELRSLTLEYFESVLPTPILVRLWALPHFTIKPSSGGGP